MRCARLLVLSIALASAAGGCSDPAAEAPRPLSVTPDRGPVSQAVAVTIRGTGFNASATTDFAGRDESSLDVRFAAFLGPVALRDVRLHPDGSLTATVPEGLPIGSHDLELFDPDGRRGSLPSAYSALDDTDTAQLVAAFRVDTVGPKQAWAPFTITVTAIDAAGATVAAFNGAASISDLTGTALPGAVGLFRDGVWTGEVELRTAHDADVLTVTDALGHVGASNPFRVAPTPAVALEFTTPPRTTTAGDCSGTAQPLTIRLLDAFGAVTVADGDVALTPGASAGLELFSDDACSLALVATVPSGTSTLSAWYRSTKAGATPVELSAPSLLAATQVETVLSGPAASLAFVTDRQTVNAGACSQPATLELRDAFDNVATTSTPTIALAASAAADFALYADAGCSIPATDLAPAAGSGRADFWFRGTVAEVVTVTASSPGLTGAGQPETINPEGNASRLVYLTPPLAPRAGACSDLVTLQAQDSFGNAVAGAGAIQLALSAIPAAGFAFFTDDLCATPAPGGTTQIGAGLSTAGVYFRGTVAGAVSVTATSTTLTAATQAEQVRPGLPTQLTFTSAPQSVAAGACSGLTSLALRDAYGNATLNVDDLDVDPPVPAAPIPVALSASPGADFAFYSDPLCATATSSATVAVGAGGTGVYFKGTVAATVAVTATVTGLQEASQDEVIRPAPADRLAFATPPQTVVAGECSGVVTVEVRDTLGNTASLPGGAAVSLAANPAAGTAWYSDAACGTPVASLAIPPGGSSATFFFQATKAGALGVTATSTGLTSATQAETVLPEPADRLVFATAPQTVPADVCSGGLLLEARDRFGNPSPLPAGATAALTASPSTGFEFHHGAGCGSAMTSVAIPPGQATATLSFVGTVAGGVTITATSAPLAAASQLETIAPLAPDRLAFVTAPQSVNATKCSQGVVVQLRDPLLNPSPATALTHVDLTGSPAAGVTFYSDSACTAGITGFDLSIGESSKESWFIGTIMPTATITAASGVLAPATQVETITPAGDASRLVFLSAPLTTTAGACSGTVTLEAQDSAGYGVVATSARPVTLAALPATGFTFFSDDLCLDPIPPGALQIAVGSSTAAFHFSGTAAGAVQVTASTAGLADAVQTETVDAAPPAALVFTSGPQSVKAGVCSSAVGLALRDTYGNPAPAAGSVAVALTASPGTEFTFYSDGACGTPASSLTIAGGASATAFSFRGETTGSFTVTATASSLPSAPTQVETITAGSPHHLAFTTGPQTFAAGSCHLATLQSQDLYDNPSPVTAGATVTLTRAPTTGFAFYAAADCVTTVGSVAIPPAGSNASLWFKGTAIGSFTVTATATGLVAATQVEQVAPAPPSRLAFTTTAQSVTAGVCSGPVTIEARDAFGNASAPAGDVTVGLSADPAAGFALYPAAGCGGGAVGDVVIGGGTSSVSFWFLGTDSGSVTVTATVPLWTGASQTETIAPAATSGFVWNTVPSPQAQDRAFPVRISAVDAFGNATPGFTGTAALSIDADAVSPTLTCASGCSVGLTTGAFTAGVWTGSVSVSAPESPTEGTPDRRLVATSGSITGPSNDFELTGTPDHSAPTARLTASRYVLTVNGSVNFSAATSSDYQTATAALEVSWDLTGTATAPADPLVADPPGAWTAWSTTKTTSRTFSTAGTYSVTVAVRDADGDVGYATIRIYVLPASGVSHCIVTTTNNTDDGGTCTNPGGDGVLSLREALDHVAAGGFISFGFAGPTTITGTTYLYADRRMTIVGPGVTLFRRSLYLSAGGTLANPVTIDGLEFTGQTGTVYPVFVSDLNAALLRDVYVHDGVGIVSHGTLTLERVRMARCTGPCVQVLRDTDFDPSPLTVRWSEFRGTGSGTAIDVATCDTPPLTAQSNLFENFQRGIQLGCAGATSILHNTFEANDTGIAYYAADTATTHVLRNNIFSGQRVAAATCGSAGFTSRDYHLLWLNQSDGCLAGDPDAYAWNPLYVFPAAGDFRLRPGSLAIDSATPLPPQPQLVPAWPLAPQPAFLGIGPDRGGIETY